jgi:pyruvate/2-oxoglutarate dehydrogenase complex dihydrolipoamide dehydrogenase (E3) component
MPPSSSTSWSKPDVIIIGTGQAGVPLARRLAAAGRRVVIIERAKAGGTCVNAGCTPTKTLVASARAAHVARTGARLGVHAGEVIVDFAAVMARTNGMVGRWRAGIERHLADAGERLRFVRGHGRFVGPRAVEVNGERFEASQIVVNVGARPARPEIPGLAAVEPLTSSSALALTALPRRLLILGAGYVACELGQAFRRLGAEVALVSHSARLLRHEDEAASEALAGVFRAEGIELALGRSVVEAARANGQVELRTSDGGGPLRGSHLLVATGRAPNTSDLGCAEGRVALDASGHIIVDERYETSEPGVFAAGDCTPGPQFTHVAWDDHRVLFDVLTNRPARRRSDRLVPSTVFTDPQVAAVGLTEEAARARGLAVEVATMPFGQIARAIETDETAGVVKIVVDASSERVLGACVVGANAGELIHVFSVLMQSGGSARAIVDGEFAHPTLAEGLQTALMKLPRYALS